MMSAVINSLDIYNVYSLFQKLCGFSFCFTEQHTHTESPLSVTKPTVPQVYPVPSPSPTNDGEDSNLVNQTVLFHNIAHA